MDGSAPATARLVPDVAFPPYSYVPGRVPHPFSDPAGHRFGATLPPPPQLTPENWGQCRDYLLGIDLFNHGYYWEAHEIWERLWHASGRAGMVGDFLKGLIKLAAAGVKVREGIPQGVRAHASGAAELFELTQKRCEKSTRFLGLSLGNLSRFCSDVAVRPPADPQPSALVSIVFDYGLLSS